MTKINNVAEKLDKSINSIQKIIIERADTLEQENRLLRAEILRLESIISGLTSYIGENLFKKESK